MSSKFLAFVAIGLVILIVVLKLSQTFLHAIAEGKIVAFIFSFMFIAAIALYKTLEPVKKAIHEVGAFPNDIKKIGAFFLIALTPPVLLGLAMFWILTSAY